MRRHELRLHVVYEECGGSRVAEISEVGGNRLAIGVYHELEMLRGTYGDILPLDQTLP